MAAFVVLLYHHISGKPFQGPIAGDSIKEKGCEFCSNKYSGIDDLWQHKTSLPKHFEMTYLHFKRFC